VSRCAMVFPRSILRFFDRAREQGYNLLIFAFHRRAPFGKMLTFYLIGSTIIQSTFTKILAF